MLQNDIVWVKLVYPDSSERIFRGTQDVELIQDILGDLPKRDVYASESVLKNNYVFDVKNKEFISVEGLTLEISRRKPSFSREVDKFANSFI